MYPTTPVDVLGDQLSATECAVLLMPVPVTAITGAALAALLTTVTVPLNAPVVLGANAMFIIADCPAASVAPVIPPVTLNPEPLMLTPEMITLELPLLISVTGSVVLPPTVSLPKLSFDVEEVRPLVDPEPEPLRLTATSVLPLLFFRVSVPVTAPDAVGLNPTAKNVVAPAFTENGVVNELMLNAVPLIEVLETVRLAVPVFLMASVWVFLFPTATVPNETDDGNAVRKLGVFPPEFEPEPEPLSPTDRTRVLLTFFNVKVPENVPDAVGVNPTAKYVVLPTPR